MVLLRSVFWLAIAFMIVQPGGMSWRESAEAAGGRALEMGQAVAAEQISALNCNQIECLATKAALVSLKTYKPNNNVVADAPYPQPRITR